MENNSFQVIPVEGVTPAYASRGRRMRGFIYGIMALAVIFAAGGLGWFLWSKEPSFTEKNLEFTIEAPSETTSGEKVEYAVKFTNHNPQALTAVRLVFFYPSEAVVIKDGQLSSFLTEEVKIDRIEPGGSGQYSFLAYVVGERGEVKKATARLIFTPTEVRSSFEKETAVATTIRAWEVALTLVAPPNAVSGQSTSYLLDYRNESSQELSNLKLKFTYPDDFTATRFNPSPAAGNNTWVIKQIKPGEGNRIVVDGLLKGSERESKAVTVALQREVEGAWINYERATSSTIISTPLLSTSLTVNDQAGSYIAQLGEQLNYQIKFTNNSEVDLTGLTISAKLEGTMFDLSNLRSNNGFFDAGSKTVTWNASSSPLLNRLAPGQYGVVDFTINLKNTFPTSGLGAKDLVAKVSVKAETATVPPGYFSDTLTAQAESVAKIKSLPGFEQWLQSSAGGLEGSGPLPPRVEQKTVYTVVWRMSNTSGDILKTVMKGVLPVGVEWADNARVSGQQALPSFKSSSREVIWDVGVLPSGTGSTAPKYEAFFQVAITPSAAQAGTTLPLIKNLTLEGEDGATRQVFVLQGRDLSTNDLADRPNQGTVEE